MRTEQNVYHGGTTYRNRKQFGNCVTDQIFGSIASPRCMQEKRSAWERGFANLELCPQKWEGTLIKDANKEWTSTEQIDSLNILIVKLKHNISAPWNKLETLRKYRCNAIKQGGGTLQTSLQAVLKNEDNTIMVNKASFEAKIAVSAVN